MGGCPLHIGENIHYEGWGGLELGEGTKDGTLQDGSDCQGITDMTSFTCFRFRAPPRRKCEGSGLRAEVLERSDFWMIYRRSTCLRRPFKDLDFKGLSLVCISWGSVHIGGLGFRVV